MEIFAPAVVADLLLQELASVGLRLADDGPSVQGLGEPHVPFYASYAHQTRSVVLDPVDMLARFKLDLWERNVISKREN